MSEEVSEELAIELEALEHMLGDGAFCVASTAGATELSIPLVPRDVDGAHEAFVEATLALTVRHGAYPAEPPAVTLRDPKGLEDDAIAGIKSTLEGEAAAMAGEMVLLHLYELAAEALTAANAPAGVCSFCLELFLAGASQPGGRPEGTYPSILKLPCFHCFHLDCFAAWFRWQQREAAAAAAEAAAVPALPPAPGEERPPEPVDVECANGWVARGVFPVRCPACRVEVVPAALAPALPSLLGAGGAQGRSKSGAWGAAHPSPQEVLEPEALEQLRDLQVRFGWLMAAQAAAGGLVQETVAVSLAELQAAAEEKRQAAAIAEEGRSGEGNGGGGGGASQQGQQGRGGGDGGGRRGRGRGRGRGGGGRNSGARGRGRGGGKPAGAPPPASAVKSI